MHPQVTEQIFLDGNLISHTDVPGALGEHTRAGIDFNIAGSSDLFESGVATSHTISARVINLCNGAGENITLNHFGVDVVGMR